MAYNGWTNRETWLVNLWLGDNFLEDKEVGIDVNEDYVQEYVNSILDGELYSVESAFIRDLLAGVLSEINYVELANHYNNY